jgi:hypothetical protein
MAFGNVVSLIPILQHSSLQETGALRNVCPGFNLAIKVFNPPHSLHVSDFSQVSLSCLLIYSYTRTLEFMHTTCISCYRQNLFYMILSEVIGVPLKKNLY